MNVSDFEQRRNKILSVVIEAYVASAVPVGSELVARRLRPSVSSATIRNVMGELEEAGLLEQPHTSAGRVPTDRGYRLYVDSLMDVPWFSREQVMEMTHRLHGEESEVEQLLGRAGGLLTELAQQASFILAPTVKRTALRQIELVPLGVRKVLCVLIGDQEETYASHVVELIEPLSREEVLALVRFINTQLTGLPYRDVVDSLERRLIAETDSFYHLVKRSLDILQHALSTEPEERLLLEGASYIVAQPEFRRDPGKAHRLLKGLEDSESLMEQVRSDLTTDRVRVRIGRELPLAGYEACSYVAAPFVVEGRVLGGVGVLGPTRMDYPRVSALVEAVARSIASILGRGPAA